MGNLSRYRILIDFFSVQYRPIFASFGVGGCVGGYAFNIQK